MRGKVGVSTRYQHVFYDTPLYNASTMKCIVSVTQFSESETAQYRLKVIQFHKLHGTLATKDAFYVSKPTIYRWKKTLSDSGGKLSSLVPQSKAPRRKRQMITDLRIVAFIKQIRDEHPCLGKEKIKPLLEEYCFKERINTISESTIGKVIKRHGLLKPKRYGRYYHNLSDIRAHKRPSYKTKVKRSPKPEKFGYLEIDTIVKFLDGMKLYVFNAIDIKLKFEFSYAYTTLTSRNGKDFLQRLIAVYPLRDGIRIVQTDNGLEFMGEFDNYLKGQDIKHVFIYPRCPKINSIVERSNRSLQEEFVNDNLDYASTSLLDFNSRMMDYLIWYNTKRVHKALNNQSPINYLLSVSPESQMYVTYTTN